MQAMPFLAYKKCRQEDFGRVRGLSREGRTEGGASGAASSSAYCAATFTNTGFE
jgi:hypothetical protein